MTPPLFGQPIEPGEPKYSLDFEEFWSESTKRGSKLAASKALTKALRDLVFTRDRTLLSIRSGMAAWIQSEQWQDETKQPHVSTWLNRRGWEEIVPRKGHVHSERCRDAGFCKLAREDQA